MTKQVHRMIEERKGEERRKEMREEVGDTHNVICILSAYNRPPRDITTLDTNGATK